MLTNELLFVDYLLFSSPGSRVYGVRVLIYTVNGRISYLKLKKVTDFLPTGRILLPPPPRCIKKGLNNIKFFVTLIMPFFVVY